MPSQTPRFSLDFIDFYPWSPAPGQALSDLLQAARVTIDAEADPALTRNADTGADPTSGAQIARFELFDELGRSASEVIDLLARQGFRPASLKATLSAVLATPQFGVGEALIALGSPAATAAGTCFPVIEHDGDTLRLTPEFDDPEVGLAGHFIVFAHPI